MTTARVGRIALKVSSKSANLVTSRLALKVTSKASSDLILSRVALKVAWKDVPEQSLELHIGRVALKSAHTYPHLIAADRTYVLAKNVYGYWDKVRHTRY